MPHDDLMNLIRELRYLHREVDSKFAYAQMCGTPGGRRQAEEDGAIYSQRRRNVIETLNANMSTGIDLTPGNRDFIAQVNAFLGDHVEEAA